MSDASDFDQIGKALGIAPAPQPLVGVNLSDFSDGSPIARAAAAKVNVPAPTPQQNQAQDVEMARKMFAEPDFMRTVVAAKRNGNDLGGAQFVRDQSEMNYAELVGKYGKEIADQNWRMFEAERDFDDTLNTEVSFEDLAMDTSASIVGGAINSAGGIAAAGVGILSDKAGTQIAKATAAVSGAFLDSQSEGTRQNTESQQLMDALDANENRATTESDKSLTSGKSEMEASFEGFGRGVMDMLGSTIDNPSNAMQTAAGGLGSLAPSAIAANLAKKTAIKMGSRLVTAEQSLAAKVATQQQYVRPAVAAAIAGTESSGVYTQAAQEILAMSHEDLAVNSPRYRQLIENGETPEGARNELAGETGMSGAVKQFGPALLGGAAMSKFEAAPFAVGSKTGALKAIAGETLEEAYQGATGELSTNRAVIENANDGRSAMDGVGEAFVEGAVGGLGMAGVTQGSGLAAEIVTDVSKAAAQRAGQAVDKRMENIRKGWDDQSTVGDKATTERIRSVRTNVNDTFDALRAKVSEDLDNGIKPDSPELKARKEVISNELMAITTMAEDEVAAIPAAVSKISIIEDEGDGNPTQPTDRINRMGNIVNAIDAGKLSPAENQSAALYLFDEVMKLSAFAVADLPAEIASMPDDSPIKMKMLNVKEELMAISQNPKFISALVAAQEAQMNQDPDDLPEVTPDVVREAQSMSVANPGGVNPYLIDIIMDQRVQGKITLTDDAARNLKLAGDLAREINKVADLKVKISQEAADKINNSPAGKASNKDPVVSKTWLEVRDEIMVEGSERKSSKGKKVNGRSISDFHSDIIQSLIAKGKPIKNRFGEMVTAKDSLEHLGMFAQSHMNKVAAINESVRSGDKVRFSNLSPDGIMLPKDHKSAGVIQVHKNSPGSIELAKGIYVEAMALVSMYNNLNAMFGDLNGKPLGDLVPLSDVINVGVRLDSSSINRVATQGKPGSSTPSADTANKNAEQAAADAAAFAAKTKAESEAKKAASDKAVADKKAADDKAAEEKAAADKAKADAEAEAEAKAKAEAEAAALKAKPRAKGKKGRAAAAAEAAQFQADLKAKRTAAKDEAEATPAEPVVNPVIAKFQERLKGKKTKLVVETRKGSMAAYSPSRQTISVDLDKIEADYNAGMTYLDGNGETTSDQKAVVFEQMDVEHFKKFMKDSGLNTYIEFIIEHEFQHVRQINNGEVYPKNLMDPAAIAMERDANKAAFKAIGYEPVLLDQDSIEIDMTTIPLVKTNGISKFIRAFKMTDKSKSTITDFVKPVAGFLGLLAADETINDQTKKVAENIINKHVPQIIKDMNMRLNAKWNSESKDTVRDILKQEGDESNLTRLRTAQIFNVETGMYDQRLIEQAALAAVHWATNATSKSFQNAERIAKSFGIQENQVTESLINAINSGVSVVNAKEELGRIIMEFWGVTADDSVTMSDTMGIAHSVAAEMIFVMQKRGNLLTEERYPMPSRIDGKKTFGELTMINPQTDENVKNAEMLGNGVDIIRRIATPGADPRFFFDRIPNKDTKSQKRNKFSMLSAFEKKVKNNVRSIEYRVNQPMFALMDAMGKGRYNRLLGSIDLTEDKLKRMNKNHLRSVTGKNMSNEMGFNNVMLQHKALMDHAEMAGKDPSEVKIFYDYYFSKVGRLMMEGFGPQNSKHAREIFVSTDAILDMTDENGEAAGDFWMTVAQSSGLVKTEKVYRDDAIATVREKIYEEFGDGIAAIQEWQAEGGEMSDAIYARIEAVVGNNTSDKTIHSLIAVAQYEAAKITGGEALSKFAHNLSIEADGKTDGPINAMVHFMAGMFTTDQLELLAKGGLFFNKKNRTLNEHVQTVDKSDLYQHAAVKLGELLTNQRDVLAQNPKIAPVNEAMIRFLEKFGEVTFDGDEMIIGRGILKNPLTIKVYGSGAQGINNNVADALMGEIYAQMSDLGELRVTNPKATLKDLPIFENYPEIMEDLQTLTSNVVYKVEGSWKSFSNQKGLSISDMGDVVNFQFNKDQTDQFSGLVKNLFTNSMVEAIDDMMGATIGTTKMIQQATQIQGAVLIEKFARAIDEETAAQRKSGKLLPSEILSKADYDRILLSLQEFAPIIENDDQSIHLGLSEMKNSQYSISRGLNGEYRQEVSLAAPSDPGVAASPNLVQNRGDGLMINNIYAGDNFPAKSLPVFDGVELAANMMKEYGYLINEAVTKGWLTNPAQDASDSFQAFLRIGGHKNIQSAQAIETLIGTFKEYDGTEMLRDTLVRLKAARATLVGTTGTKGSDAVQTAQAKYDVIEAELVELGQNAFEKLIVELGEELKYNATSIQARKNVMKQLGFSVDHMASTETPHTHEGRWIRKPDGEELVYEMNVMYQKELRKLTKEATLVQNPSTKFTKLIEEFGNKVEDTSIVQMDGATLLKMLESEGSSLNDQQKKVLKAIRKSVDWDMSIVFGSKADLREVSGNPDLELGQMDMGTNTMWVSNISAETVLHELVHATTMHKVYNYYMNPETLSKQDRDAVRRLEVLMDEFMRFDPEIASPREGIIIRNVQNQIAEALDNESLTEYEQATVALNEFMAWTLTNQNLINITEKTVVRNPMAQLVGKTLELMRRLMGFEKRDMWSNILFNTNVLASTKIGKGNLQVDASMTLNQTLGGFNPANNERLSKMIFNYRTKLAGRLKSKDAIIKDEAKVYLKQSVETVDRLAAAGFAMTMQEKQAFMMIQANLQANLEIDSTSMLRVQKIYDEFLENQDYTVFMENEASEVDDEHVRAQTLFNALTLLDKNSSNKEGVSNLLTSFVALSQTNEKLRAVLEKIDMPKALDVDTTSVDGFLTSVANSGMTALGMSIDEGTKNKNVSAALDKLAVKLSSLEDQAENYVLAKSQEMLSRGDGKASLALQTATEWVGSFSDRKAQSAKNVATKSLYQSAGLVAALLNKERGALLGKEVISLTNDSNMWKPMRDMIGEIIGITDENASVYLLVDKVKAQVSAVRQAFRETLPKIFKSKFKGKVSEGQWTAMFKAMGQSDLAALRGYQVSSLMKMIKTPAVLATEISSMEGKLKALVPAAIFKEYQRKGGELADHMMGKGSSVNQLRNANAISMLLNEKLEKKAIDLSDDTIVDLIDKLVSLYALDRLSTNERKMMSDLIENESEALEFMVHYLDTLRTAEHAKINTVEAELNGWKGHIPSESQGGLSLVLAKDSEHSTMMQRGYTKLRAHNSIGSSYAADKRSYYFSSVAGRNTYSQGIMQTVQTSVNGVDPLTGRTLGSLTAGSVLGKEAGHLNDRIKMTNKQGIVEGAMLPVFGQGGVVVAYEFGVDNDVLVSMNKNTNLGEMIGAWAGRQNEEKLAQEYNEMLVDRSLEIMLKDQKDKRMGEYIWLNNPKMKDAVYRDSWAAVPIEMQNYIKENYPDGKFMVRKDMIDNIVGYRDPSVADAFTGDTRMDERVASAIRDTTTVMFGANAFKYLVTAEKTVQTAVTVAKQTIVIRSVFVPAMNAASNILQLVASGVDPVFIAKGTRTKLVEIDAYLKNVQKIIELDAEIAASTNLPHVLKRLEARKTALQDANSRMSIHPLIEAGAFSTISEGVTDVDEALTQGKYVDWLEAAVAKMPDGVQVVGKNLLLTKDTALFQGLSKAVQYGDFVAKAIYYDHLIQKKGKTADEALIEVFSEFVNFNLLPGRTRTYAEKMGATWFWAFKIRSMKVARRMIIDNPARALMSTFLFPMVTPDIGIGSPITDNFASVWAGGRLDGSIGLSMLERAPSLNPWYNLFN
jgi:hypothetical protein